MSRRDDVDREALADWLDERVLAPDERPDPREYEDDDR